MAGPENQQQQVGVQQVNPAVIAPAAIPGATGVQKLQYLAQTGGPPDPTTVAMLIKQNATNRDAMVAYSQQTWGNEYTQGVIAIATQPAPLAASDATAPSALGAPGAPGNGVAPPKVEAKAPAGKASTGWVDGEEKQVDDAALKRPPAGPDANGIVPPPQFVYDDANKGRKDSIMNPAGQNYRATNTPVQPAPGQIVLPPDAAATTPGGERSVAQSDTTRDPKLGTMTTTIDTSKTIDPNKAPVQLDAYKKQADAALDEQITALTQKKPLVGGRVAPAGSAADPTSTVESLKQAKAKLAEARTEAEVDTVVQQHGLLVAPNANQTYGKQVTTQQGSNLGGVLDGSAVYANNKRTAEMAQTDANGSTVTQTTDKTREVGTKGVNFSNTTSTTKVDADGKTTQTTAKDSLSGGITDPLKLNASSTTAKDGKVKNLNGGGQVGDGFGGGALGGSRIDEKTGAGVSASGKAGMVNDANGTGAKVSLDDARTDLGGKQVSGGFYGSADGQIQMLVTPADGGGVTITLTASGRLKAGAFGGKRDSTEPVTAGADWNASGGVNYQHAESVTRTRTLSADEAKQVLGDLDAISTGPKEKRVFGAAAQEKAYSAVFHGKLKDLWSNDGQAHVAGESASKITESGGGVDAKAGASTGADAGSRTGAGGSFNVSKVSISGEKESMTATETTHAVVVGGRTSFGVDGNASEGVAGATAGYNQSNQATKSYVFTVPNTEKALLDKVRSLKTEPEALAFAKDHPELYKGVVEGNVDSDGKKVGANVGPIAVAGGTQSTETGDVAKGQQVVLGADGKPVLGADGKPVVKKSLSGTQDGERKDDASASLLGVKLAQGNTTVKSHGAVDPNGQSALDVTQSDSEEQISKDNVKKNAADMKANMGKADVAVTAATGGPMAFVKKLAERVGEASTVGAHFDDAAFNQLLGVAAGDHKKWDDSILVDYRPEWFALRNELNRPYPPADWLAQDDSGPDHLAAKQLARMKSIAHFIAVAGPAGQQAIAHARGEYGPNAIGATVSWPPSLADQKPIYADLTNKVEHLRATLLAFAKTGDSASGKALLEDLGTKLGALRQRVQDAPDHKDPTLGVRAANGIGDMQQTVATWGPKFDRAVEAQKTGAPIESALDGPKTAKSTDLDKKEKGDDQKAVADAKTATAALEQQGPTKTYGAARPTDKQYAEFDKQHAAAMAAEQKATDQQQADHDAQTAARASEAKSKAEATIPDFEQRCLASKGKAFGLLDGAVAAMPQHIYSSWDTTEHDLDELGTLMHEWSQNRNQLVEYYKNAGWPADARPDLAPGLSLKKLELIYKHDGISDALKAYCGTLKNQWGKDF